MKKFAIYLLAGMAAAVCHAEDSTPLSGDVNGDGVVDAADAIAECRYIIKLNPTPFDDALADVNGDGSVNVCDATEIVAIYIDAGAGESAPQVIRRSYDDEDHVYLGVVGGHPGETVDLTIYLDNPITSVTSFQMELVLPEGVTVDGEPELTSRAPSTHDIMGNMISTDRYMLICVSTSLRTFTGTEGAIVKVPLKLPDTIADGAYVIRLENVELVSPRRIHTYIPDSWNYLLIGDDLITSVQGVGADSEAAPARCFTLDGRQADASATGILIRTGNGRARKVIDR